MKVFRLAKEKLGRYRADDLSGNGAALAGGRWNPRGVPVLYTCCHASTAVLEARVHASGLLPVANFYLVTLEVPDRDRKSTRLNSSHQIISYAVFCLKKKKTAVRAQP